MNERQWRTFVHVLFYFLDVFVLDESVHNRGGGMCDVSQGEKGLEVLEGTAVNMKQLHERSD